jgi:gluconate 2-dehydrogenase alpha chain
MLQSGIGTPYDPATGEGVVGRSYCYQTTARIQVFFEDEEINPFVASGANGMAIDDVNGDNFDHAGLGFLGGALIFCSPASGRPIMTRPVPPGTPRWGAAWKKATAKWYLRTMNVGGAASNMPNRYNCYDLDPTYRNPFGQPLLRLTYNYTENDRKVTAFVGRKSAEIARMLNATIANTNDRGLGDYSIVPYQSTHNTGGAIMGKAPRDSVVNKYMQSWDVPNVFVLGACAFTHNSAYNPTGPVGAIAYWTADAIRNRYRQKPGLLV